MTCLQLARTIHDGVNPLVETNQIGTPAVLPRLPVAVNFALVMLVSVRSDTGNLTLLARLFCGVPSKCGYDDNES